MRALLYIRVSDDEQAKEGFSIPAQEALLRRKCLDWGYAIAADPYIDEGYSAKNTKRPSFQRMIADIPKLSANVIVFWRLDRFSRNSRDFQKIAETLDKLNCGIKSCTEQIDTTTAMGRFQLELTISLGQLERETTAERVKFVMEERHRKGLRNGAIAPYGYELIEGKLIVRHDEVAVVKRIYELYQNSMSSIKIAHLLNQEGNVRRGFKWSNYTVMYILSNPVYCGKLRWNDIVVDGEHEAIMSVEEFEQVSAIRKRRFEKREKPSKDYHFTGVMRCARCGYGMIGKTQRDKRNGKTTRYYICTGRATYGICNMPFVEEGRIVDAFLSSLNPDSQMMADNLVVKEIKPDIDMEQETVKRGLEEIKRRRKKWQEAFAAEAISLDELKAHMAEEKAKEEVLNAKHQAAPAAEVASLTREEIIELLGSFRNLWHSIQDEQAKKRFVQTVFKEIVVNSPIERGASYQASPIKIVSWKLNN